MRRNSACLMLVGGVFAIAVAACGSTEQPPQPIDDNCSRGCTKAVEAHCTKDSAQECANGCAQLRALTVCRMEIETASACGAMTSYTCDMDGHAQPAGCKTEFDAVVKCVYPDAGDTKG